MEVITLLNEMKEFYAGILSWERSREPVPMERTMYRYLLADQAVSEEEREKLTNSFWATYFEDYMDVIEAKCLLIVEPFLQFSEGEQSLFSSLNVAAQMELWEQLTELAKSKLTQAKRPVDINQFNTKYYH